MAYVRLDKIKADAHIESIVSNTDLRNGQFVSLGALVPDGEARTATLASTGTSAITPVPLMHCSVPLQYGNESEQDFVLKTGKVGRAYVLEKGDIISVSADLMSGSPTSGTFAPTGTSNTSPVWSSNSAGNSYNIIAELIAVENDPVVGKLYVLRITRADS